MTFPDGSGPDLIVDDGGDATLLIHKGYQLENYFNKHGKVPEITTEVEEEQIIEELLREVLEKNPNHWHNVAENIIGLRLSPLTFRTARSAYSSKPIKFAV